MEEPSLIAQKVAVLLGKLRLAYFGSSVEDEEVEVPMTYVIYARRSTNTPTKQERSIADQILECNQLATRLNLRVLDVIHEEESAKVSDKRPLFRDILDAIKLKKYNGIITWAPDRLARNMKEAGEVIDMLDHDEIRDLRFANGHSFTNSPSGKMLLGIAFIMAKEFSDTHSQTVTRGNKNKTREGKWPGSHLKHGYYKDKQHYLRPDGDNHKLICNIFEMRLAGKSQIEIVDFLKKEGYPVATKHTERRKVIINVNFVSKILHDPFYAGILIFGETMTNLFEKYNFVPAVSVENFEVLCKIEGVKKDYVVVAAVKSKAGVRADLMRGMVMCSHCKNAMSTGITKDLFYYRCDTHGCKSHGKSTRAKVILTAAKHFINNHPLATEEGYGRYVAQMEKRFEDQAVDTAKELRSLQGQWQNTDRRLEDVKDLMRMHKNDKMLISEFKKDMKKHRAKLDDLDQQIEKLKGQRVNVKSTILTFEEFHELFKNTADLIGKIDHMADLDFVMRKIFMNFAVEDGKVIEIRQTPIFAALSETKKNLLLEDTSLVTSKTTAMNLWRRAKDIIPLVLTWNGEMAGFLQQERKPQLVAVTY